MSECRLSGCDRPPGEEDGDNYRTRRFCSWKHDVKYDDLKQDAMYAGMGRDPSAVEEEMI